MDLKAGQSLKYNGSSKISKISKIEGDTVYFTDNSRAGIDLVNKSYSEPTISELIGDTRGTQPTQVNTQQHQPQQQYQQPINENYNNQNQNNNMGQSDFGNNSLSALASQIQGFNTQTNQQQSNGISIGDAGSGYSPTSTPFNPLQAQAQAQNQQQLPPLPQQQQQQYGQQQDQYSGLDPETARLARADVAFREQQKDIQQQNAQQQDNILLGGVKRVDAGSNQQQLEDVQSYNNGDISEQEYNKINESATPNKVYRHNPKLPKMRKTKAIKINLIINEMIPKLEDIRAVDSLFDDVSIVEELGKEIASKYINDPEMLENLIIADLEKKVKATRKKKAPVKKTPVKKTVSKAKPSTDKDD